MKEINTVTQNNGKSQQFVAVIIINLVSVSIGIIFGWPSPIIPQLRSSNPPVGDTSLTEEQIVWINGYMTIGALLIIPFCGILAERLGRKTFALFSGLPHISSWILIIFAQNHIYLYAARFIGGMAVAMTAFIVPMYTSEIATEDIRGILGSLFLFCINIGILFAYVAGVFLSYQIFAFFSLLFSFAFVMGFIFMPESPVYLMRRSRQIQAYKSLLFLRGNNRALVDQEMSKLQSEVNASNSLSKAIGVRGFFKDRATRKGLIISFGLLGGAQLSGIIAMISYAEMIFKRASSSISPETAPIIIGVIQIFSSCISTMLMERAGRRLLILISCFGMATSHIVAGVFFYLQQNNHDVSSISWLPLLALSTYIVTYCLGIGPVPFVVTSEVFRQDVSSFASTLSHISYWTTAFAAVETFGTVMQILGVSGCFFMLAIFCAACFVFAYCLMIETKGRRRQDIVNELAGIVSYAEGTSDADKVDESVDLVAKPVRR